MDLLKDKWPFVALATAGAAGALAIFKGGKTLFGSASAGAGAGTGTTSSAETDDTNFGYAERERGSSMPSSYLFDTPGLQVVTSKHPAAGNLCEIYNRLFAVKDERELFSAALLCVDRIEQLVNQVRTLTGRGLLQQPIRANEQLRLMKLYFSRLADLVHKHDPSETKRTTVNENAKQVYQIMEDRIKFICSVVEEYSYTHLIRGD